MLRVMVLGAVCELRPNKPLSSAGITVREFADLDNGQRVYWREDRGWSGSTRLTESAWPVYSGHQMMLETVMVIESEDHRADSYIEYAFDGLHSLEVEVDPASLYSAPFRVEHGPHLAEELRRIARRFNPFTTSERRSVPSRKELRPSEDRSIGDHATHVDYDSGQEDLQINLPRALFQQFSQYCSKHQVTRSAVVRLLIEMHLSGQTTDDIRGET